MRLKVEDGASLGGLFGPMMLEEDPRYGEGRPLACVKRIAKDGSYVVCYRLGTMTIDDAFGIAAANCMLRRLIRYDDPQIKGESPHIGTEVTRDANGSVRLSTYLYLDKGGVRASAIFRKGKPFDGNVELEIPGEPTEIRPCDDALKKMLSFSYGLQKRVDDEDFEGLENDYLRDASCKSETKEP